jgi:U3 small nucleolar RNA-associated protein 13
VRQKFRSHLQSRRHQQRFVLRNTETMAQRAAVKTTYAVARTIQPIYSGGSVALSEDGRILAACVGEDALLTDLTTGKELARIEGVWLPLVPSSTITNSSARMGRLSRRLR